MRIRLSHQFSVRPAHLFKVLHDYSVRKHWDTFVPSAQLLSATEAAAGVLVRCRDRLGLSMDTVYVGFRPPYLATIRLAQGPRVFQSFAGSWRIIENSAQVCTLVVTYNVKARPAALRLVLEPLIAAVLFAQTYGRLRSLAKYLAAE